MNRDDLSRRAFLRSLAAGAGAVAAPGVLSGCADADIEAVEETEGIIDTPIINGSTECGNKGGTSTKPNIVIIQADQLSYRAVGAHGGRVTYGGESISPTRYIDELAAKSVVMTNFFTNSPACTPSRGAFMTGLYPHKNGASTNDAPLATGIKTFGHLLAQAGYKMGYAGKWHLAGAAKPGFAPQNSGFEKNQGDVHLMFNRGHWKKILNATSQTPTVPADYATYGDENTYTTDVLGRWACDFITANAGNPFCCMVSFPDPHDPYAPRSPYKGFYAQQLMAGVASKQSWRSSGPMKSLSALKTATREYFGSIKLVDEWVNEIMNRLLCLGLRQKTIVVFTSDHGELMGLHGRMYKGVPYEAAARIPFIISWPGGNIGGENNGREISQVASTVDFAPTLLSLAGVTSNIAFDGTNIASVLRGNTPPSSTSAAFLHFYGEDPSFEGFKYPVFTSMFTNDYEMVLNPSGTRQLYQRSEYPKITNIAENAAQQDRVADLTASLVDHHQAFGTQMSDWVSKNFG